MKRVLLKGAAQTSETHECCALTQSGAPCSLEADRTHNGRWYCHVHDPWGQCQYNLGRAGQEPDLQEGQPDVPGQMTFEELTALHTPPTKDQMKSVKRRFAHNRRVLAATAGKAETAQPARPETDNAETD
jgi:hypothetical protein